MEFYDSDIVNLFNLGTPNRAQVRLDLDEAALLFRCIREYQDAERERGKDRVFKVVEIGRYFGGSTILLAASLATTGGRVLSLDKAPQDDAYLKRKLGQLGLGHAAVLETADSSTYEPPEEFALLDAVFIDGGHSYEQAKRDHLRWGRRVRAGGLIIHHDMAKTRPNATQIVELARLRKEILEAQSTCAELVEEAGSLSVFRRRGGCWRQW